MCPRTCNGTNCGYSWISGIDFAKLKGKPCQPVANRVDTEHHHVHHHRVRHVLIAGKTCFHQRKAGLHKEYKKTSDDHPHHVDTYRYIVNLICGWVSILCKNWRDKYKC